jgi:hypothetical protein
MQCQASIALLIPLFYHCLFPIATSHTLASNLPTTSLRIHIASLPSLLILSAHSNSTLNPNNRSLFPLSTLAFSNISLVSTRLPSLPLTEKLPSWPSAGRTRAFSACVRVAKAGRVKSHDSGCGVEVVDRVEVESRAVRVEWKIWSWAS